MVRVRNSLAGDFFFLLGKRASAGSLGTIIFGGPIASGGWVGLEGSSDGIYSIKSMYDLLLLVFQH